MCCKNTDLTGYFKGFTTKIVYNPTIRIVLEGSFRPSGPDRYTKRYTKKPPTGGFSGCRTALLRHAQRLRRHNHTVIVGVDKLARYKHHAAEFNLHVHITDVALVGFQRVGTQRLHTQVSFHNDVHIADAAVHNDAFPAIFGGLLGQHVAQQCMAHGTTTVDNHDLAFTVDIDGKGKVMVVDGGGSMRHALLGDMLAEKAAKNGWEGIIVYGCIRDVDVIMETDLGVQALGTNPLKTDKRN